jgi:hypothetical protein
MLKEFAKSGRADDVFFRIGRVEEGPEDVCRMLGELSVSGFENDREIGLCLWSGDSLGGAIDADLCILPFSLSFDKIGTRLLPWLD